MAEPKTYHGVWQVPDSRGMYARQFTGTLTYYGDKPSTLDLIHKPNSGSVTVNAQYDIQRTLTLNSSAGQLVEGNTKSFTLGGSYKIANFNQVLKIKSKQQNVNNDLTFNLNVKMSSNTALIRKIEFNTAQATSGTRTWSVNFTANYVMSKRITLGAYFDYQSNTPLVSTSAYPTTSSNYGLSINMSLVK